MVYGYSTPAQLYRSCIRVGFLDLHSSNAIYDILISLLSNLIDKVLPIGSRFFFFKNIICHTLSLFSDVVLSINPLHQFLCKKKPLKKIQLLIASAILAWYKLYMGIIGSPTFMKWIKVG